MDKKDKQHPFIKNERARAARALRKKQNKKHDYKRPKDAREAKYIAERLKPGVTKLTAAARAGYNSPPIGQNGERIERQIRAAIAQQFAEDKLDADRVLLEVWRLALIDIADLYDENGKLLSVHELDEDTRRAIIGLETSQRRFIKVKLAKEKALEMLLRHFGKLSGEGDSKKDRLQEVIDALKTVQNSTEEGSK